ncbi:hypothetical protein [Paenibacillus macerans]|uniref:hypothetical protein n=1 Tax=Paenibacillus macerans TaxID=44252 RepID=UPI003D317982
MEVEVEAEAISKNKIKGREHGTVSSTKSEIKSMDFDSTLLQSIQTTSVTLNETIDLGMLVRNKDKNGITTSEDVEKMIRENQEVYVLRCKIS